MSSQKKERHQFPKKRKYIPFGSKKNSICRKTAYCGYGICVKYYVRIYCFLTCRIH